MSKRASKALPTRKARQSSGGWIITLLLIALSGGGYYGYETWQKHERDKEAREAARLAKSAAEKLQAMEAARLAAEKEKQKKLAAEQAEKERLAAEEEARRKAEEKARRHRDDSKPTPAEPEPPKTEEPDKPEEPEEPAKEAEKSVYDTPLPLHGPAGLDVRARKEFDALVDHMLKHRDFDEFEKAMSSKIKDSLSTYIGNDKLNYASYKNNRNLMQAVDLCLLIRMVSSKDLEELLARETEQGLNFFHWALQDKGQPLHTFMQSYLTQEGRDENSTHSLNQLFTIWSRTNPKDRAKYLNLIIAGALINPQTAEARGSFRGPAPCLTVPEVCAYLMEMDKKRKLVTDIKKLSVSQLLHVVDVRLPRSEFDWAAENVNYTQANWAESYGSVKYIMERAALNKDLYKLYSLEEIRREGGVCRDQGYFSCNSGKCRGVPAVYIVGDGDRGPHAWMVNLVDNVRWVQTNSYGYNSGRFTNPCSGRSQHESTLLNKDAKTTDTKLAPAADSMILADYLSRINCHQEAQRTARYVTSIFPTQTSAWAHLIKVLGQDEENLPPDKVWRRIVSNLMQLSKKNTELMDLAAEVEEEYLLNGKNAATKQRVLRNTMSQLSRRGGDDRADLVLSAVNRQAEVFVESKNLNGLAGLYRKQLKNYTKRGDIFGELLSQYMGHLGDEAPARAWATLAKDAEKIFEKEVRSNSADLFKLKKECAIQHQIASAWEKAGNKRKAEKLREEASTRQRQAENQYSTDD